MIHRIGIQTVCQQPDLLSRAFHPEYVGFVDPKSEPQSIGTRFNTKEVRLPAQASGDPNQMSILFFAVYVCPETENFAAQPDPMRLST